MDRSQPWCSTGVTAQSLSPNNGEVSDVSIERIAMARGMGTPYVPSSGPAPRRPEIVNRTRSAQCAICRRTTRQTIDEVYYDTTSRIPVSWTCTRCDTPHIVLTAEQLRDRGYLAWTDDLPALDLSPTDVEGALAGV